MKIFSIPLRLLPRLSFLLAIVGTGPVYAGTCSSPAGNEADVIYNSASHTYQFCNGTSWIQYQPGFAWQAQANFNPAYPAGVGFFVMSHSTYNGNLGDQTGADATCLTDLTTNTGWKGYSTANGRGLLISAKVHAFLCEGNYGTCGAILNASTTYYFANAGNSTAGGASFTTDGSSIGPNDNADWGAANYFWGNYEYWTDRFTTDAAHWQNISWAAYNCSDWTDSSSGNFAFGGLSTRSDDSRWDPQYAFSCNLTLHLICYVNP